MNRPRTGLHSDSTVATRRRAADERTQAADARDRLADERERAADARDWAADERDRVADGRDQAADERERIAGDRDRALDSRQAAIAKRQLELRAWEREVGAPLTRAGENARMVDEGRERLARSRNLLHRLDASLPRRRDVESLEPPAG